MANARIQVFSPVGKYEIFWESDEDNIVEQLTSLFYEQGEVKIYGPDFHHRDVNVVIPKEVLKNSVVRVTEV